MIKPLVTPTIQRPGCSIVTACPERSSGKSQLNEKVQKEIEIQAMAKSRHILFAVRSIRLRTVYFPDIPEGIHKSADLPILKCLNNLVPPIGIFSILKFHYEAFKELLSKSEHIFRVSTPLIHGKFSLLCLNSNTCATAGQAQLSKISNNLQCTKHLLKLNIYLLNAIVVTGIFVITRTSTLQKGLFTILN